MRMYVYIHKRIEHGCKCVDIDVDARMHLPARTQKKRASLRACRCWAFPSAGPHCLCRSKGLWQRGPDLRMSKKSWQEKNFFTAVSALGCLDEF